MNFQELKQFITKDMRMAHIYQPVMLIELLKNQGKASVTQIAQAACPTWKPYGCRPGPNGKQICGCGQGY